MTKYGTTSASKLALEAQKVGHDITHTTISQIRKGNYQVQRPKRQTLEAIAYLAGVPEGVAYKAAGLGERQAPFAEQLPEDADLLDPIQRRAVLGVIRAFISTIKSSDTTHSGHTAEGTAYLTEEDLLSPDELPPSDQASGD